jgi:hypothetical protein
VAVWVQYRNKGAIVAVGGKIVTMTKKAHHSRSNVVLLIVFFIGRASFNMNLFMVSQWTILLGSHEVFEGGSTKEEA